MNPAAMVALIDYREIDGEERPVNATVAIGHNFKFRFYSHFGHLRFYIFENVPFQVIMFFKHGLEEEKV